MSKTTILDSKTTPEEGLGLVETERTPEKKGAKQEASNRRMFFAPEGYRRLTINLPEVLHKKLRLTAIEQDCTATEIIKRLLMKELLGK